MEVALINTRNRQQKIVLDKLPAIIGQDAGAEVPLQDSWIGCSQCILNWEVTLWRSWIWDRERARSSTACVSGEPV